MVSRDGRTLAQADAQLRVESSESSALAAQTAPARTPHAARFHVTDEGIPYLACLNALFLVVQGASGGREPVTVLVCVGVYFATAFLVQDGTPTTRVGSAAVFTALLATMGAGFGLALT